MKRTYVANVTLFDGTGVRNRQGVLIAGERVAWVGPHARAPREARAASSVEGEGHTLTPGLIDCHVHLQFDGGADFEGEARALTPALAALKAAANLKRHLANGVTTVRDLGGMDAISCDVGRAVRDGLIEGPRVLAAGRALTITGGHGHNVAFAREVDGADAMRKAVREEIRAGATAIKVVATGGVLTPGIGATFTAYTSEELAAAVDEAHRWDRCVAAHAIGAEGILHAVRAGVDSVEHCNHVTAEIAREMKARGTFRSPTLSAVRGILDHADEVPSYAVEKARLLEQASMESHRRAVRAGIRHVCGTDAGTPFNRHGNAPTELVEMVRWGMTPLTAMQAATRNGAELLRLEDVGSVTTGSVADLVLYDADPVDDITAVLRPRTVWKAAWPGCDEAPGRRRHSFRRPVGRRRGGARADTRSRCSTAVRTSLTELPDVEHVHGDRNGGLACWRVARGTPSSTRAGTCHVRSARWLTSSAVPPRTTRSSRRSRCYPDEVLPGADDSSPTFGPPFPDTEEITEETYGPLKVACEREALRGFPGRCLDPAARLHRGAARPHGPVHVVGAPRRSRRGEMLGPGPAARGCCRRSTSGPRRVHARPDRGRLGGRVRRGGAGRAAHVGIGARGHVRGRRSGHSDRVGRGAVPGRRARRRSLDRRFRCGTWRFPAAPGSTPPGRRGRAASSSVRTKRCATPWRGTGPARRVR